MPVGATVITETLPAGTTLTSVSTSPSALLVSSNLAAGTATVTVNGGAQTIITFQNTFVPTTGFLQICKVAGSGVAAGTNFTFTVAGTPVTVAAGSCSQAMQLPVGQAAVIEGAQTGTALVSVSASPVGRLVASNLTTQTATVNIVAGGVSTQTVLTFTNEAVLGLLKICKVAGTGVTAGTPFTFTVGSNTLSVPAGFCSVVGSFPVGTQLTATETIPAGGQVTAIGVLPADRLLGTPNLARGSIAFTIGAGVTDVSFTNSQAIELGLLKVCKIAGTGVATGSNFTFVMGGTNFTVPAGFCVKQGMLPVGTVVTIAELSSTATVASAISVLPADRQGTVDLPGRAVTATVGVGVTEVYFTNVAR